MLLRAKTSFMTFNLRAILNLSYTVNSVIGLSQKPQSVPSSSSSILFVHPSSEAFRFLTDFPLF